MSNSDRRNSSRQSQEIGENLYYEEEQEYALPRNGLTRALLIGFAGGVVALVISIIIVLENASLFNEGARLGANMSLETASSILKIQLLSAGIDLIIAFIVGILVGWIAVKRRRGFWAGMVTGAVIYIGIFLAQYIPNYPGVINNNIVNMQILGALAAIIQCLFYAVIGGLLSLWGARIVTRKHPYYLSRRQKARLKE